MKKWEKEIVAKQIDDEQQVIWRLEDSYKVAMKDVEEKIQILQSRPQTPSVIYQLKQQQQLQQQLEGVFSKMTTQWYKDVDSYLGECYEDAFFGTMYCLHQEGIPLIMPFDQTEMAQMAAQSDYQGIKLSKKLYANASKMARIAREEMTRGIAAGDSWAVIAGRVAKRGKTELYKASRIVRTESHRITNEVKMNTITKATEEGADVVKQWDSTIDARTRSTHIGLDGQLREVAQPFKSPSGATAMYPGGFGVPWEDIQCRCVMLQRARWALDKSELDKCVGDLSNATDEQLDEWADKLGVSKDELIKASNGIIEPDGTINHSIKAQNYNDFKKKYKTKSADQTAQFQGQLDVLNEEKKKLMKQAGYTDEDEYDEAVKALEELFGADDPEVAKWKSIKQQEADLKKKLPADSNKTPAATKTPAAPKPAAPVAKTAANTSSPDDFDTLKKNSVKFNNGEEADKYHREKNFVQSRWDNDLTENERKGICTYTTNAYGEINWDLRNDNLPKSRYKNKIDDATTGLEKCLLAEDTVVFRGMTGGVDSFSVWSGIPVSELSKKSVQDGLIGTRLLEKGFMSTGTNAGSAWSGLKLEVYLPKGSQAMYVAPVSAYPGKYEILVQRNSTFEIKEVRTDGMGQISGLVLRLVEQKH